MAKTAILIPIFERGAVLRLNLGSLVRQDLPGDLDIIVLDDCRESDPECFALVEEFASTLPIRYIHSGQTKTGDYWRIPGFPFNIGAKQAGDAKFLLLCCAEMYHFDNTIQLTVDALERSDKIMVIPHGKKEDGPSVAKIVSGGRIPTLEDWVAIPRKLNAHYPYLMGIHAADYDYIRGYDEDFTGIAADDDDFILRMKSIGCNTIKIDGHVCHQIHSARKSCDGADGDSDARRAHNRALLRARRGIAVRNEGREWGKL